jgi:hypothetical protein
MPLVVIFSNKPSPLNKKLVKFFQINLINLNKASLIFNFEVADPKDINKYISKGVKNYPVLIDNDKKITGVEKIIDYLKLKVKTHNDKIINKTDTDRLDEFWKQTMGDVRIDESGKLKPETDDEPTSIGDNLQHKIQAAFEERNSIEKPGKFKQSFKPAPNKPAPNKPAPNIRSNNSEEDSPSQTLKNMKGSGSNPDDVLMAKFFENMEESN